MHLARGTHQHGRAGGGHQQQNEAGGRERRLDAVVSARRHGGEDGRPGCRRLGAGTEAVAVVPRGLVVVACRRRLRGPRAALPARPVRAAGGRRRRPIRRARRRRRRARRATRTEPRPPVGPAARPPGPGSAQVPQPPAPPRARGRGRRSRRPEPGPGRLPRPAQRSPAEAPPVRRSAVVDGTGGKSSSARRRSSFWCDGIGAGRPPHPPKEQVRRPTRQGTDYSCTASCVSPLRFTLSALAKARLAWRTDPADGCGAGAAP